MKYASLFIVLMLVFGIGCVSDLSEDHQRLAQLECGNLTALDEKDFCYFYEATVPLIKHSAVCKLIANDSLRNYCLGIAHYDVSYCDKGGGDWDDKFILLRNEPNVAISYREYCYVNFAFFTHNASWCNKITRSRLNITPNIPPETIARDWCYQRLGAFENDSKLMAMAIAENDSSMCEQLIVIGNDDKCRVTIAEKSRPEDATVCEVMRDQHQKDVCYWERRRTLKDPSLCAEIADQVLRDDCYEQLASSGNFSICGLVTSPERRDLCYCWFAIDENRSLCDMINGQERRDLCQQGLCMRPH